MKNLFSLRKPCADCPFLKHGGVQLSEGRLQEIAAHLLENDFNSFFCHKSVHSKNGGEWVDGDYIPSHNESMCFGSAVYLHKLKMPSVQMRIAVATKQIEPEAWSQASDLIIDNV